MSQPFASLLMKGRKTIETRNSDIFRGYQARSCCTWAESHGQIRPTCFGKDLLRKSCSAPVLRSAVRCSLKEAKLSDAEIEHLRSLPRGFSPGQIVGIVEVRRSCSPSPPRSLHVDSRSRCARAESSQQKRKTGRQAAASSTACPLVTSLPQGISPHHVPSSGHVPSSRPCVPRHVSLSYDHVPSSRRGAGGQVGETYLAPDSERGDPAVEAAAGALRRDMVYVCVCVCV